MNSMANYISIVRLYLALALVFIKPLSIPFCIIYIVCGVSDVLDGYLARKTKTTSKLGENLDTLADLVLVGVILFLLYPIINPTVGIIIWIISIGIIRGASVLIVLLKYKTFGILHSYANKATGFLLFLFPLLLTFVQSDLLIYIVCIVASVSSAEEIYIHLTSSKFSANRKGLFVNEVRENSNVICGEETLIK